MSAAFDHIWSNFSAALEQNQFLYHLNCFLDVFQESTAHVLCHSTDQDSSLYFLLESVGIEDYVFNSVDFEVKF